MSEHSASIANTRSRGLLEADIARTWPLDLWQDTRILLAVSGGADSTAMLHAIVALARRKELVEVAHFNHGWRGGESNNDEAFVRDLCTDLGVRCHVGNANSSAHTEEAARQLRYDFLTSIAYQTGARYVLTAHTASDRVETLLHNLFRGTGLAGVCRPQVIRNLGEELVAVKPLLSCWREDVLRYLADRGLAFREDSSNSDTTYTRNFLRHNIVPLLREHYGTEVETKLLSFSQITEEAQLALESVARNYLIQAEALFADYPGSFKYPIAPTALLIPTYQTLPKEWPIVHQALHLAWLLRNWPLQSMNRESWLRIRGVWEDCSHAIANENRLPQAIGVLPGRLHLIALNTGWILVQPQD